MLVCIVLDNNNNNNDPCPHQYARDKRENKFVINVFVIYWQSDSEEAEWQIKTNEKKIWKAPNKNENTKGKAATNRYEALRAINYWHSWTQRTLTTKNVTHFGVCVKYIVGIGTWNCHWCHPNRNANARSLNICCIFLSLYVCFVSVLIRPGPVRIRRKQIKQHDTNFETVSCVTDGDVHRFQHFHRFACTFSPKHKYLNRKTNFRINFEIKVVHRWSLMNRIVPIDLRDCKKRTWMNEREYGTTEIKQNEKHLNVLTPMQTEKCVSKVDECGTIETNVDDRNKNYFWCFFFILSSFTWHAIESFFFTFRSD